MCLRNQLAMTAARAKSLAFASALLAYGTATPATAQTATPSADQMVKQLERTESRSSDSTPNRERRPSELIELLRRTRGITFEERNEIANIVKEGSMPVLDVDVPFDYKSVAISPQAEPVLIALGEALGDEKLEEFVFLIAGHTDAKGGAQYNLALSEVRSKAVREFLIDKFHIDPKRLVAVGFGEEQLKNKDDPLAAENRRVQVVPMAPDGVAGSAGTSAR
jgi:outer membrane protein OmpA-like peptidoglycan-associated protein